MGKCAAASGSESLRQELSKVREQIKSSLSGDETIEVSALLDRLHLVETENKQLKSLVEKLESRLAKLEGGATTKPAAAPAAKPAPAAAAPAKKPAADDDDIDLFGDDDDEDAAEKERIREERLKAYADKKAKSTRISNPRPYI